MTSALGANKPIVSLSAFLPGGNVPPPYEEATARAGWDSMGSTTFCRICNKRLYARKIGWFINFPSGPQRFFRVAPWSSLLRRLISSGSDSAASVSIDLYFFRDSTEACDP